MTRVEKSTQHSNGQTITSKTDNRYRVDPVRFDGFTVRDNGSVIVDAVFTRVGVFDYIDSDGNKVSEFRPPEEVGRQESLDTMVLTPFTNEHPAALLNADTIREHQVGTIGENIDFDGTFVKGRIVITDRNTIDAINAGKHEVSMGYEADVVEVSEAMDIPSVAKSPGVWNGKPYTKVQRNIRTNHGSLVGVGRAGPNVRLRLDSALNEVLTMTIKKDAEMQTVQVAGMEIQVPPEAAVAINMLKEAAGMGAPSNPEPAPAVVPVAEVAEDMEGEEKEKPMADMEGEEKKPEEKNDSQAIIARLEAERDALKAKLDSAEKVDEQEKFDAAVRTRIDLERNAAKVAKCDHSAFVGLSDMDVRKHALKAIGAKFDGDDAYTIARFDVAVDMLQTEGVTKLGQAVSKSDSEDTEEKKKDSRITRDGMAPLSVTKR